jgi:hypothetical protein
MGKLMISLSDKTENLTRKEVEKIYHGRVGGLSIFFEVLLHDYFKQNGGYPNGSKSRKSRSAPRPSNGTMTKPARDATGRVRANTGRLAARDASMRASATPRDTDLPGSGQAETQQAVSVKNAKD